jgi:hypothetical protein
MNLFKYLSGSNFRIYNLEIAELVSVNASIVLGWLSYVADKHNSKEIFTTYDNISNYTKLTDNEIRSSLNKLVNCGYITIVKKGIPAKNYYTIQEVQIFSDLKSKEQVLEKVDDKELENSSTGAKENEAHIKNSNKNTKKNSNINNKEDNFSDIFEDFRIYYRSMGGKVLGLETEFKNFKKHKDWKIEINNLKACAEKYFHLNKNNDKKYLKHLKTFINNREWEIDFEIVNEEDQLKVFLSKFNEYELYLYKDSLTDYLKMLIKNNWDNDKMESTTKYLRKYFMNTWPYMVRGLLEKASMSNQFVIDFENYSHRMQDFEEKQWREEFNDYDKLKYHI